MRVCSPFLVLILFSVCVVAQQGWKVVSPISGPPILGRRGLNHEDDWAGYQFDDYRPIEFTEDDSTMFSRPTLVEARPTSQLRSQQLTKKGQLSQHERDEIVQEIIRLFDKLDEQDQPRTLSAINQREPFIDPFRMKPPHMMGMMPPFPPPLPPPPHMMFPPNRMLPRQPFGMWPNFKPFPPPFFPRQQGPLPFHLPMAPRMPMFPPAPPKRMEQVSNTKTPQIGTSFKWKSPERPDVGTKKQTGAQPWFTRSGSSKSKRSQTGKVPTVKLGRTMTRRSA